MSLEQSMKELAESNIELAKAQTELAGAQRAVADKYDEMIAFVNEKRGDAPASAADKPKGRGRPAGSTNKPKDPEPEPEQEEDDGLGGDGAVQRTEAEVKELLKKFKEAGGVPKDIMSQFGAKAFPEVKPADYNDCYAATEKALAKL